MSAENRNEQDEPIFVDKRRVDPETGKVRDTAAGADASAPAGAAAPDDVDTSATAEANVGDEMGAAGAPEAGAAEAETVTDEELEQLIADATAAEAAESGTDGADDDASAQIDAATAAANLADLQRVTAEYANYRRRTEQEKIAARDANTADVLRNLLPVLDDLDRAAQHGDLPEDGAMTVIANKFRGVLDKLGLVAYGEQGEAFDPTQHEAIAQLPNPEATGETIADVVERGYRVGERIVRVAKVAVFVPAS